MKRIVAPLIVLLGVGAATQSVARAPEAADVAAFERTVRLPRGAGRLADYARYYTVIEKDGHPVIAGRYLSAGITADPPGRYLHAPPVTVMDGGCSVVTVLFDLTTRTVIDTWCNGVG